MREGPADRYRNELKGIRTFPSLVRFLRDEMGWPIESDDFEEMTFEYSPEELGIDAKNAAKIEEIKRLRPLAPNQPWGIFFVKFEPKRLPVVALRRILSRVALKKRASANSAERQSWETDDLLFVSNYVEGDQRQISFAHFSKPRDRHELPTLKVLGWDNLVTPLHLDSVAEKLTSDLAWPKNQGDVGTWRRRWSDAFTLGNREVIKTSKELSLRLAELARSIRDGIKTALAIETERGPLTQLMKAFQGTLIHDLDADGFADMYAQTIAYGLLSARIADPEKRTIDDLSAHMQTNPFLRELLETFLTAGGGLKGSRPELDFDELGIADVIQLLDRANMEAVVRDFGDRNPQEDPVIHFYEHFLAAYDKKQKVSRGVFYTPRPVVSYIVRSVDELLRTEFGLGDGLADTTTWGEMAKRNKDLEIPEGTSADQAFVQLLDPATGTGTFLVEAIDLIHKTMVKKWGAGGRSENEVRDLWNEYVPSQLLTRLYGYELLMAPYAIAHLKIGLKLYETGYRFESDERARVYLTNALEPASNFSNRLDFAIPALAHESEAVNAVKQAERFTLVVGNPPYSVLSANLNDVARKIVDQYRQVDGQRIEERSMLRLEMHLQDDYVKFLALCQHLVQQAGVGVLGVITNSGYLDNLTLRGVRFALWKQFHNMTVLDLHGGRQRHNRTEATPDQNVFEIEQGVAITTATRSPAAPNTARVSYAEATGTSEEKAKYLLNNTAETTEKETITPQSPYYFFVPHDESKRPEYDNYVSVTEVMPVNISGIVTAHDNLVVDFGDARLRENARILRSDRIDDEEARRLLRVKDNAGWKLEKVRREFRKTDGDAAFLRPYAYRPFDVRRIYYQRDLVWCDRRRVMSHILAGENVALATCRQLASKPWEHVFVTRHLQDDCLISNRTRERSYHFPLYLYEEHMGATVSRPNLAPRFLETLSRTLGLEHPAGHGLPSGLTPEDILGYAYAVFHSPRYRKRYAEFLKIGFPRLPLTGSLELFRALARLGDDLVALHALEPAKVAESTSGYTGPSSPEVARVGWLNGVVWLDAARTNARQGHRATKPGTIGFQGVPEAVWDFHIGAYQVCHKWLKDRKGSTLSNEDIAHYQKIVVALSETIRLMTEIDEIIEAHGGWPGAFETSDAAQTEYESEGREELSMVAEKDAAYKTGESTKDD